MQRKNEFNDTQIVYDTMRDTLCAVYYMYMQRGDDRFRTRTGHMIFTGKFIVQYTK